MLYICMPVLLRQSLASRGLNITHPLPFHINIRKFPSRFPSLNTLPLSITHPVPPAFSAIPSHSCFPARLFLPNSIPFQLLFSLFPFPPTSRSTPIPFFPRHFPSQSPPL